MANEVAPIHAKMAGLNSVLGVEVFRFKVEVPLTP